MTELTYMQLAANVAKKAIGQTWTNPLVGAVLVKNDHILAVGYHHRFGLHHAEVDALNQLPDSTSAAGATLYVTLEPCSHYGKQPPCVKKVVQAGIKQVVIGQLDPNPLIAGRGLQYLKEHHVQTELLDQTFGLNEAYNFYYQHHRPQITVKYAMTLDGKINHQTGQRSLVTGKTAYQDAQDLRAEHQAILIGRHTLTVDDPLLTVRTKKLAYPPVRLILTHDSASLDLNQRLLTNDGPIWLLCQHHDRTDLPKNVTPFVAAKWTPAKISHFLAEKQIQSLLVEGGSQVQAEFVSTGLVDKLVTYIAPKIYGGQGLPAILGPALNQESHFKITTTQLLDTDLRIEARRK